MIRFGINGFGRIGRCIVRIWLENKVLQQSMQLVQINSPSGGKIGGHLLQYDSIHGVMKNKVEYVNGHLMLDDHDVLYTTHKTLEEMNWQDIDMVLECSGRYKDQDSLSMHLSNGVKKVLLSSPGSQLIKRLFMA